MTTEEKAYKDSLLRAKAILNGPFGDQCHDAIIQIFPELKESKDEKIRKELMGLIKNAFECGRVYCTKEMHDTFISYLETQKEHQETCTKLLAKILKHSAEGFRNVLKKKGIDYIPYESFWTNTVGTFSKQECNEFYKWMDDMTMELVTEETPEYKAGFKAGVEASVKSVDFEKQKEQKPLSTEEIEMNSLAFLEQLGYTCIPHEAEQKHIECEEDSNDETKQGNLSVDITESIRTGRIGALENLLFYLKYERKSTQEEIKLSFIPCIENLLEEIKQKHAKWSKKDKENLKLIIAGNYLPLGLRKWICGLSEKIYAAQSKEELAKILSKEYNKGKETGEKEGYIKGYDRGYKAANESKSYHFPDEFTEAYDDSCEKYKNLSTIIENNK